MKLHATCDIILSKLSDLELARRQINLTDILSHRIKEWTAAISTVGLTTDKLTWFELDKDIADRLEHELSELRERSRGMADQLTDLEQAASLSDTEQWVRLLKFANLRSEKLREILNTVWTSHKNSFGELSSPGTIRAKMPHTPRNVEALLKYEECHLEYSRLVGKATPTKREDVSRVAELSALMHAAITEIDFNVPDDVANFLKAVASGGARLDLLTPTVTNWLQNSGQFGSYIVRARGL